MEVCGTVAGGAPVGEIVKLRQLGIEVVIVLVVGVRLQNLHLCLRLVRGVAGGGRGRGGGGRVLQCCAGVRGEWRGRGSRDRGAPLLVHLEPQLVMQQSRLAVLGVQHGRSSTSIGHLTILSQGCGLQIFLDRERFSLLLLLLHVVLLSPVELNSEIVEPGPEDSPRVGGEDGHQTPPDGGEGEHAAAPPRHHCRVIEVTEV